MSFFTSRRMILKDLRRTPSLVLSSSMDMSVPDSMF